MLPLPTHNITTRVRPSVNAPGEGRFSLFSSFVKPTLRPSALYSPSPPVCVVGKMILLTAVEIIIMREPAYYIYMSVCACVCVYARTCVICIRAHIFARNYKSTK